MPYIYSEYMTAALTDEMYFRPVSFDYPEDAFAYQVEDQLMVGDSIMIAPVYVEIGLNELVIFVKKNHVLPLAVLDKDVKTTADVAETNMEWLGFIGESVESVEYVLYNDDGISRDYVPEKDWKKMIVQKKELERV